MELAARLEGRAYSVDHAGSAARRRSAWSVHARLVASAGAAPPAIRAGVFARVKLVYRWTLLPRARAGGARHVNGGGEAAVVYSAAWRRTAAACGRLTASPGAPSSPPPPPLANPPARRRRACNKRRPRVRTPPALTPATCAAGGAAGCGRRAPRDLVCRHQLTTAQPASPRLMITAEAWAAHMGALQAQPRLISPGRPRPPCSCSTRRRRTLMREGALHAAIFIVYLA